jgi:hypothetical protein
MVSAEVDDVVDDQHGGAVVEKPPQDADIERMRADGEVVEHEARITLVAAELGDELEPLRPPRRTTRGSPFRG